MVEVDQTILMILPPRAFPSPKSLVEVADEAVWLCYRDTNRHRLPPDLSKSPDLRLVLEIGMTKVHPLGKGEEAMGNDDGDLDRQTSWIHFQILAPMGEGLCHGSPLEDAWNHPIHWIEWYVG